MWWTPRDRRIQAGDAAGGDTASTLFSVMHGPSFLLLRKWQTWELLRAQPQGLRDLRTSTWVNLFDA